MGVDKIRGYLMAWRTARLCWNCGTKMNKKAKICPKCGVEQVSGTETQINQDENG
jgi:rRNA maturation endonuclease Nob1